MNVNFELFHLQHKLIILDLTLRTLERDMKYIDNLKINRALQLWFEKSIQSLKKDLREVKKDLGKNGVKLQSENIGKDGFTEYTFIERGTVHTRRYSNIALKNWVDEEVKRLLGLEYRKSTYIDP